MVAVLTRIEERAVTEAVLVMLMLPELVIVVVPLVLVLTPSSAAEIVPALCTVASPVAPVVPIKTPIWPNGPVAWIVAPDWLVMSAAVSASTATIAASAASPAVVPVVSIVAPDLLVSVTLSTLTPDVVPEIVAEFVTVAATPPTPDDSEPVPCTVPELSSVATPFPKLTAVWPSTVPPDCTVTFTVPVLLASAPLDAALPFPVVEPLIVLVPLTVMSTLPVGSVMDSALPPLPVLVTLPEPA